MKGLLGGSSTPTHSPSNCIVLISKYRRRRSGRGQVGVAVSLAQGLVMVLVLDTFICVVLLVESMICGLLYIVIYRYWYEGFLY